MTKNIFLIFILLFSAIMHSQNDTSEKTITSRDSVSKNIKYQNDIPLLVSNLTKDSKSDLEKARAIFIWITNNISYDYKLYNKGRKYINLRCEDKQECDQKLIDWKNKNVKKVLRKKKGICSGYAQLFKKMCDIAGVDCIEIEGYTKTEASQIGRMGDLDHAWNAIIIGQKYYYLDVTWASGYCTEKDNGELNGYVKNLNEYYWLTPVDKLSRNHFPKDTLQLVNSKYSKKAFKRNPYIENSMISKMEIISPNSGVINSKIGDTIKFSFQYLKPIDKFQINTNISRNPKVWKMINSDEVFDEKAYAKQKYITPNVNNDIYSFDYIVTNNSVRFIEILFEHRLALKYLIKVTKPETSIIPPITK